MEGHRDRRAEPGTKPKATGTGTGTGTGAAAGATAAGEDWCRRQNAWRTTWTGCAAEHIPREHHPALQLAA